MKHRKKSGLDFKSRKKPPDAAEWYDAEYDRILIEQSIAKQYGVLPSAQANLHYSDWAKMVSGLMDDTPLGRVVACRMEKDPEMLKHFTPEQRRIQSEWRQFRARKARQELQQSSDKRAEWTRQMAALERMFASLTGGDRR